MLNSSNPSPEQQSLPLTHLFQITPQASQDQTLPFTQAQVMALLTSSPDPTIALVTTLEEGFGLAWAQEAFWDTSLEIRGEPQKRMRRITIVVTSQLAC